MNYITPYWVIFSFVILLGMIFFMILIGNNHVLPSFDFITDIILQGIIIGFIISMISAIVYSKYQYRERYNRLCDEIYENHKKTTPEAIEKQCNNLRERARDPKLGPDGFIPFDKTVVVFITLFSDSSQGKDHWRYLPNNEYKTFILLGSHSNIPSNVLNSLTLFYFYCEQFSVEEQNIEKHLHPDRRRKFKYTQDQINGIVEWEILQIQKLYDYDKPYLDQLYKEIANEFQKISILRIDKWIFGCY